MPIKKTLSEFLDAGTYSFGMMPTPDKLPPVPKSPSKFPFVSKEEKDLLAEDLFYDRAKKEEKAVKKTLTGLFYTAPHAFGTVPTPDEKANLEEKYEDIDRNVEKKYPPVASSTIRLQKETGRQWPELAKEAIQELLEEHPIAGRLVAVSEAAIHRDDYISKATHQKYPLTTMATEMSKYIMAGQVASGLTLPNSVLKSAYALHAKYNIPINFLKAANYLTQSLQFGFTFYAPSQIDALMEVASGKEPTWTDLVIKPAFEAFKGLIMGGAATIPNTGIRFGARILSRGAIDTLQKYTFKDKTWMDVATMMTTVGVLELLGLPKKDIRLKAQSAFFENLDPILKATVKKDAALKKALSEFVQAGISQAETPQYQNFLKQLTGGKEISPKMKEAIKDELLIGLHRGLDQKELLQNLMPLKDFAMTPGAKEELVKIKTEFKTPHLTKSQLRALEIKNEITAQKGQGITLGEFLKKKPVESLDKNLKSYIEKKVFSGKILPKGTAARTENTILDLIKAESKAEGDTARAIQKLIQTGKLNNAEIKQLQGSLGISDLASLGKVESHKNRAIIEELQRLYAKDYKGLTVKQAKTLVEEINTQNVLGLMDKQFTIQDRESLVKRTANLWKNIILNSTKKKMPESLADKIVQKEKDIQLRFAKGELTKGEARIAIRNLPKEVTTPETTPGEHRSFFKRQWDDFWGYERNISLNASKAEGHKPDPGPIKLTTIEPLHKARIAEHAMREKYLGVGFQDFLQKNKITEKDLLVRFETAKHKFSGNEIIDIYNAMGNPIAWNHVNKAYNFSADDKNKLLFFVASHPKLKILADYMRNTYTELEPKIRTLLRETEYREMGEVGFYSPIRVLKEYLNDKDMNVHGFFLYGNSIYDTLKRGSQIERTGGTQPMRLDGMGNFINSIMDGTHLVTHGRQVNLIGRVLKDEGVKEAIMRNPNLGPKWSDEMGRWLNAMNMDTENRVATDAISSALRYLRGNISTSTIYNFTIAGKAFLTNGLTAIEVGPKGSKRLIYELAKYAKDTNAYKDWVVSKAPWTQDRWISYERDVHEFRNLMELTPFMSKASKFKTAWNKKAANLTVNIGDSADFFPSWGTFYKLKFKELKDLHPSWPDSSIEPKAIFYSNDMSVKTKPSGLRLFGSGASLSKNEWFKFFNMFRSYREMVYNYTGRKMGERSEGIHGNFHTFLALSTLFGASSMASTAISRRTKLKPKDFITGFVRDGTAPILLLDRIIEAGTSKFQRNPFIDATFYDAYKELSKGDPAKALYEALYAGGYAWGLGGIRPIKKSLDMVLEEKK